MFTRIRMTIGILLLLPLTSYADFGTRGGGHAVVCDDNGRKTINLFDFYEVPLRYHFNLDLSDPAEDEFKKVEKKISEISKFDLKFSWSLNAELLVFKKRHNFIPSETLKTLYDSGSPVKVSSNCTKTQFAVNRINPKLNEFKYLIDEKLWAVADSNIRAGLIFHEILYNLNRQYWSEKGHILVNSERVRYYNALIHSDLFSKLDGNKYWSELLGLGYGWISSTLHSRLLHGVHIQGLEFINEYARHSYQEDDFYDSDIMRGHPLITPQNVFYKGQKISVIKDTSLFFNVSENGSAKLIGMADTNTPFVAKGGGNEIHLTTFKFDNDGKSLRVGEMLPQPVTLKRRTFIFSKIILDENGKISHGNCFGEKCKDIGMRVNIAGFNLVTNFQSIEFHSNGEIKSGVFWTLNRIRVKNSRGKRVTYKAKSSAEFFFNEDGTVDHAKNYPWTDPFPKWRVN